MSTRTEKPWGYEELVYQDHHFACKYLFIEKGKRTSLQYHEEKTEAITVLSGLLRLEIMPFEPYSANDAIAQYYSFGASFVTAPGVIHRMEAIEDCLLWECSTNHLDDVVRLADDYGRVEEADL